MGDDEPDVGEQRAGLQVLAGGRVEAVDRRQRVEQLDREAGDVGGVGGVVVAPVGELTDAPPGHVAQVVERTHPVAAQPAHRVEQHTVAERSLAVRELRDPEHLRHGLQDQRPGDDDVGAPGSRPGTFVRAAAVRWSSSAATTCDSSATVYSKQL